MIAEVHDDRWNELQQLTLGGDEDKDKDKDKDKGKDK